jgi:hypothetical protein
VLDITITKRSGNPTYDAAIERGIRSSRRCRVRRQFGTFPPIPELNLIIQHERYRSALPTMKRSSSFSEPAR